MRWRRSCRLALVGLGLALVLGAAPKASLPDGPFWPMALGNSWTYRFTGNPAGQDVSTIITIEVMGRSEVGGRAYWLLSGYPGRMGPFDQQPLRVRWDPNSRMYVYLPRMGNELPFLPMDHEFTRTTTIRSGNAAGWGLAGAMRYVVCKDCKGKGKDEWLLRAGIGVLSRSWDGQGSWGRYVLQSAVIRGRGVHPGITEGDLNVEARATPMADHLLMELFVRNLGDEAMILRFPTSMKFDFRVIDGARERVLWQWSAGRFFLQALQEHYLGPGEEIHVREAWNWTRGDGSFVVPGRMFLEGVLPGIGGDTVAGPVPFDGGPQVGGSNVLSSLAEEILGEPALELVVDYSSSMSFELAGRSKMAVVQRGVENLLLGFPEDILFAMRVFGSDAAPGCDRTNLVHPLGKLRPFVAVTRFLDLVPAGESALSRAIVSAALDLRVNEGPRSIFIITDGGDSCGQDPGSTVRALLAEGHDFTLEVFGYSLPANLQTAYRRLAQSTGGDFHPFVSIVELASALEGAADIHLTGGELLVVSAERTNAPLLILDSYGQIAARGLVGQSIPLSAGYYSVRILGDNPEQIPGITVTKGRRRLVFLEERLRELAALESSTAYDLDCYYSPWPGVLPPCFSGEGEG
ncbi:hypothetical protein IIA16_03275 [bacterium]|nr:hypothetical protein [bacterium]